MRPVRLPFALSVLRRLEFPRKLGLCERAFGRRLEGHGVCWVEASNGRVWKLDLSNPTHRWIVYGKYEGGGFIDWATGYLRPDAVVVDSGANIGQMLLYLAPLVPRGRVLAFEPGTGAAAWLQECLAVHPDLPVQLRREALGERSSPSFLLHLGPMGSHGSWNQISETGGEPVQIVTLDQVADREGIRKIDLWKLDVEGHEPDALAGACELMRERRIAAIHAELAFGKGARVVDRLREFGFRGFEFDRRGRLRPLTAIQEHSNGLFLLE